jgi:hypothetical protein
VGIQLSCSQAIQSRDSRSLKVPRKEGEEMARSKGNIFSYMRDAGKTGPEAEKLYAEMADLINTKGKNETPESLRKKFHKKGYKGVKIEHTTKLLNNLKNVKDPSAWDWSY